MSTELDPIVGNWYRHPEKGDTFRVVEIDEDEGTITVQNFDGDLEQIEEDAWLELELEAAEEPEDWTGPIDVEADDTEEAGAALDDPNWRAPRARPAKEGWEDEDDDDWDEDEPEDDYDDSDS